MKIELTSEQEELRELFREFAESEVAPQGAKNDREERIDPGLIGKVAEKGFLGSMIEKRYNGMGLDEISIGHLNEEIGKGCSSLRCLLTVHGMAALAVQKWGTQEQRDYWLPKFASGEAIGAFALSEPNIGSDASSIEMEAVADGGHYILNGKKKWITMGQTADVFVVFAKVAGKHTAFLVERGREGFSAKPMRGLMGFRASMTAELDFQNVRVPACNIVGSVGTGLSHVALSALDYGRYTIAWGCVGLAQACLKQSIKYARKRKQFGVPLRQHQLIQKMITEMVVNIKAARMLCYNAGYLRETGDPESIMDTWIAKYHSSIMVNTVASHAVQIHGGNGCIDQYPVERYYRDARINEIIEGSTQMHEAMIATNAFRYY